MLIGLVCKFMVRVMVEVRVFISTKVPVRSRLGNKNRYHVTAHWRVNYYKPHPIRVSFGKGFGSPYRESRSGIRDQDLVWKRFLGPNRDFDRVYPIGASCGKKKMHKMFS